MKPPPFDYLLPQTLEETLDALDGKDEDVKLLAGGQSLLPLLSLRLARPSVLVDLNQITALSQIEIKKDHVTVGAMTREVELEHSPEIRAAVPLLAEALPLIGHVAIRTRGTLGGSLAHADPAAELPAVAIALDATFQISSKERGERTLSAKDFFQGYFTTAIESDEILTHIEFPRAKKHTGYAVTEVARRHGDFAMAGAVSVLTIAEDSITEARLALINMAETPIRAKQAELALLGSAPSTETFAEIAELATKELNPPQDLHATSPYRRTLGATCIKRSLELAATRARSMQ